MNVSGGNGSLTSEEAPEERIYEHDNSVPFSVLCRLRAQRPTHVVAVPATSITSMATTHGQASCSWTHRESALQSARGAREWIRRVPVGVEQPHLIHAVVAVGGSDTKFRV